MLYTKDRDSYENCLKENDVIPALDERTRIRKELVKKKHAKLILRTDQPTGYWLLALLLAILALLVANLALLEEILTLLAVKYNPKKSNVSGIIKCCCCSCQYFHRLSGTLYLFKNKK